MSATHSDGSTAGEAITAKPFEWFLMQGARKALAEALKMLDEQPRFHGRDAALLLLASAVTFAVVSHFLPRNIES